MACLLAVYASHPPVTRRMATRASGLPATALTGLDLHQLDFNKRFRYLIIVSPLPRLSQREPELAELGLIVDGAPSDFSQALGSPRTRFPPCVPSPYNASSRANGRSDGSCIYGRDTRVKLHIL
jgi:hypothetical protein